jgi:hypothetical protein
MQPDDKNNKTSGERPNLDRRYGEIGISAVAAAVRYQGKLKKPADAQVVRRPHDEREEATI